MNLDLSCIYFRHFRRDYDMSRPFKCVAANVTEYIKTLAQAQELNVDEAEVRCQNQDDVCFGTIEVRRKERYVKMSKDRLRDPVL